VEEEGDRIFERAAELEARCAEVAMGGDLVLAARGRLARRILHRCRLASIGNASGWVSPRVFGLEHWIRSVYEGLWDERRPMGLTAALRLWHAAAAREPAPVGLSLSPSLYLQLQESYELLQGRRLSVQPDSRGDELPAWRARVTRRFRKLAAAEGWADSPDRMEAVCSALAAGRVALPTRVVLAGFDDPAPVMERIAEAIATRTELLRWRAAAPPAEKTRVRVFPVPLQECQAVAAEALDAWNRGQRRLGIAFFGREYGGLLARCLDELAAGEPLREGALRYNLTQGTPLTDHPLVQNALTPLSLASEGRAWKLLPSLLASPYARPSLERWSRRTLDLLCSATQAGGARAAVEELCAQGLPLRALAGLLRPGPRSLEEWLAGLARLWRELDFPVRSGQREIRETDELAWRHLCDVVEALRRDAGDLEVTASEAAAWIASASSGIEVIEKTPETAGIQVLPVSQARGLAFDGLWIVGCHGRALPPPVPDHPLLSPEERALLEEASPRGQWVAGQRMLEALAACSKACHFSRAAQDEDERPYLPCPLLEDEPPQGQALRPLDLWSDPPEAWLRARWLRGGLTGLASPPPAPRAAGDAASFAVPSSLNVTQDLQALMQCPQKFFCARALGLEPLPDHREGIPPPVRGQVIHSILAAFVQGILDDPSGWPDDGALARRRLEAAVDAVLERHAREGAPAFWRVERARLLGDDDAPGLLTRWLEMERERAAAGWRFLFAEKPFEDLALEGAGTALRGRMDRADAHPEEGLAVWDYKTGQLPSAAEVLSHWAHPQLPAYAAALTRRPLTDEAKRRFPSLPDGKPAVRGGYVALRRVRDLRAAFLREPGRGVGDVVLSEKLGEWERAVTARLEGPRTGRFAADPRPPFLGPGREGACAFCPYDKICGYFDGTDRRMAEEEEEA
jgi:RecB family exonuclease